MKNKISVIVPVYNVESHLHRCVDSIINQTLQNLEIILVDDGSRDTSGDICDYDVFEIQDKASAIKRVIQNTSFSVWRRLYKTSLIHDLRFIPKIIHQDVFYTIDMLNRIEHIGYLNKSLYNYNTDNESIIRSKYSLEKITIGIKATEYIMNNIPRQPELQQAVNNYITYYYTDHFFLLSRNSEIDPNKLFRQKLRIAVRDSISLKNYNIRSFMVIFLPYRAMELISSTYYSITSRY